MDGIRGLLRARADPFSRRTSPGMTCVPLDAAVLDGHCEAVEELVRQLGIERCGGERGGAQALEVAAGGNRVDIMGVSLGAGVVDSGMALVIAAEHCYEACVKLLLEHHREVKPQGGGFGYVNQRGKKSGRRRCLTPSSASARLPESCDCFLMPERTRNRRFNSRALRGVRPPARPAADTFRETAFTPLELTADMFRETEMMEASEPAERRRHGLEAIRRLLLRLEAVRARSWLWAWAGDAAAGAHAARGSKRDCQDDAFGAAGAPLVSMLPVLRRATGWPYGPYSGTRGSVDNDITNRRASVWRGKSTCSVPLSRGTPVGPTRQR